MAKILIADDEVLLRRILDRALRDAGHDVEAVGDGREVVQQYRKSRPDLVITDLVMPRMHGMDAIAELRRIDSRVPIIAISAGGRGDSGMQLGRALKCGASAVLQKPFTITELQASIDKLLAGG